MVPYVLILQADLLDDLQTVVVAPLVLAKHFPRPAKILNPVFRIGEPSLLVSMAELDGVFRQMPGERVGWLADERDAIVAAIDLLVTGI